MLFPDVRDAANVTTLTGHALQAPIIAAVIAFVWPTRTAREIAVRGATLIPLIILILLLDLPFILAAEL